MRILKLLSSRILLCLELEVIGNLLPLKYGMFGLGEIPKYLIKLIRVFAEKIISGICAPLLQRNF